MILWLNRYHKVRATTEQICESLEIEDYVVQSHPDVSPVKWHLGHTTWFFESFILVKYLKYYQIFNDKFHLIFNSYYKSMGHHWVQGDRGQLSRPTVLEVKKYRKYVDDHLGRLLNRLIDKGNSEEVILLLELGINHEQQHQELLFMDIKYNFAINPLNISYVKEQYPGSLPCSSKYLTIADGVYEVGQGDGQQFFYDNETPRHKVYIQSVSIRSSLVTNREYIEFIEDNGYQCSEYWYSDAWLLIELEHWQAPFYWFKKEGSWLYKTLYGEAVIEMDEPVSHVSFYEAAAFAKWSQCRLPTEFEWEVASYQLNGRLGEDSSEIDNSNFMESGRLAPIGQVETDCHYFVNLHGNLWEWTQSSYQAYPGYVAPEGALGEYNSKFMNGPMVLRGGCYATPGQHYRKTYRNFFNADKRWMFSGIRLCKDGTA